MRRLEVRVGEACREAAGTVRPEAIRGLDLELDRLGARTQRTGRTRRPSRVLGPLAAAASIAVIAAGAVVVPRLVSGATGHPGRARHASAPKPNVLAALPRFTVLNNGNAIDVVATATGRVVGRLRVPAGQGFAALAGTASDRTFFAVADLNPQTSCQTFFYRFTLSADGQPSALTPLPVRRLRGLPTALAASPDGSVVGYSVVQCASDKSSHVGSAQQIGGIGLIDLATGKIARQWSYTLSEDYTTDLSMSADGSLIGYSNYQNSKSLVGRVLPAGAPSGPDQRHSRIVVRQPSLTALSGSGRLMYAIVGTRDHAIAAYATANGQQVKVLHVWPSTIETGSLALDPTGRYALLSMTRFSAHKRLRPFVKGRPCNARRVDRTSKCEQITPPQTHFVAINLITGKVTTLPFHQDGPAGWGMLAW